MKQLSLAIKKGIWKRRRERRARSKCNRQQVHKALADISGVLAREGCHDTGRLEAAGQLDLPLFPDEVRLRK